VNPPYVVFFTIKHHIAIPFNIISVGDGNRIAKKTT